MQKEERETDGARVSGPRRWDAPFGTTMTADVVDRVLSIPPLLNIDASDFPPGLPLLSILQNDARIRKYVAGDIIIKKGDYSSSVFLVLSGDVRVLQGQDLGDIGDLRQYTPKGAKGTLRSIAELARGILNRPKYSEYRAEVRTGEANTLGIRDSDLEAQLFVKDIDTKLGSMKTEQLQAGSIFGELAAFSRSERTSSVLAASETELLEIRWQGIRDIRKFSGQMRDFLDDLYRRNRLHAELAENELFSELPEESIAVIAKAIEFESFGDFDWHRTYRDDSDSGSRSRVSDEPLIASKGDYPDSLILVVSGFIRLSQAKNHGHETVGFARKGDLCGLEELASNWRGDEFRTIRYTLTAIGYADIVRIPGKIVEEFIFPVIYGDGRGMKAPDLSCVKTRYLEGSEPAQDQGALEFLVNGRFINGTATMLVDLDRCVRCDDCANACAAAHANNPRFNRHGYRHDNLMVANACMHCVDPVCLIGCPTGAIHRSGVSGEIVIDDITCIGCATCADACPYDNIRMVEARSENGEVIVDNERNKAIMKATKCDLCEGSASGPACQTACPHDALVRLNVSDFSLAEKFLSH